ncbi:MAG: hypothetical protein LBP75_09620 [Planctomycetota bacterium]|jgi:hypothetical protein|nr:hypothetical protein [Planctomycetota bacterium]
MAPTSRRTNGVRKHIFDLLMRHKIITHHIPTPDERIRRIERRRLSVRRFGAPTIFRESRFAAGNINVCFFS